MPIASAKSDECCYAEEVRVARKYCDMISEIGAGAGVPPRSTYYLRQLYGAAM